MIDTCKRKGVSPNPGSFLYLKRIWDLFASKKLIKLFFVELNNEKICGSISILFGKKVYMWKFGWSGKYVSMHPNEFIYWKTIEWAIENGFDSADFMGTSKRYLPSDFKNCTKIPACEVKGKDDLKLGFGGNILVFPDARIVFNNPLLHAAYRIAVISGNFSGRFKKIIVKKLQ